MKDLIKNQSDRRSMIKRTGIESILTIWNWETRTEGHRPVKRLPGEKGMDCKLNTQSSVTSRGSRWHRECCGKGSERKGRVTGSGEQVLDQNALPTRAIKENLATFITTSGGAPKMEYRDRRKELEGGQKVGAGLIRESL